MDTTEPSMLQGIAPETVNALLPGYGGTAFCEVNLDCEAMQWRLQHPELFAGGANALLDPAICQSFLDEIHARMGVTWSYGGYLEDRRHLLRDSYLKGAGGFVHLGVDFSLPQGTPVATPCAGVVFLVDDDHDRDGGWGPRVFLRLDGRPPDDLMLIFAHLQGVDVKPGIRLPRGTVFAEIGGPPDNGNWVSHLHVQAIRSEKLFQVLIENFAALDGYGQASLIEDLKKNFPDPLPIIGWK